MRELCNVTAWRPAAQRLLAVTPRIKWSRTHVPPTGRERTETLLHLLRVGSIQCSFVVAPPLINLFNAISAERLSIRVATFEQLRRLSSDNRQDPSPQRKAPNQELLHRAGNDGIARGILRGLCDSR